MLSDCKFMYHGVYFTVDVAVVFIPEFHLRDKQSEFRDQAILLDE